jgi:hypothetical protein
LLFYEAISFYKKENFSQVLGMFLIQNDELFIFY